MDIELIINILPYVRIQAFLPHDPATPVQGDQILNEHR